MNPALQYYYDHREAILARKRRYYHADVEMTRDRARAKYRRHRAYRVAYLAAWREMKDLKAEVQELEEYVQNCGEELEYGEWDE